MPLAIYSDNGSNFIGASADLKFIQDLFLSENAKDSITEWSSTRNVNWHFSPARSPHFGVLWEAAVKVMKTLIKKHIGIRLLSMDELSTVIIETKLL